MNEKESLEAREQRIESILRDPLGFSASCRCEWCQEARDEIRRRAIEAVEDE